jgi:hypothetical protein
MNEKQILLVKLSWSNAYRRPEIIEEVFLKKLKDVAPSLRRMMRYAPLSKNFVSNLNFIVLNIQEAHTLKSELNNIIKEYCACGFDRVAFNSMIIAFLLTMKKILGNNWTMEIQNAWVMTIATMSHRYNEATRSVQYSAA